MFNSVAAAPAASAAQRMPRWARRLIDGPHPWGAIQIAPVDRTGRALRYRLIVYPPGITDAERRWLVLHSRWPAIGTTLGVAVSAVLGEVMNGWAALAIGAAVFLAGAFATTVACGGARRGTRRLTATVFNAMGYHEVCGDLETIERCAGILVALDARRGPDGFRTMSPVEYEHLWGRVYDELAAPAA
ncbi:DUF6611 family protein [Gryllotalpicola reticulitermitis]|uniref:DUF6611 family protein n=1 Tax=Gryllotalpicola reticulitermitis TaxID=1184153 RepID=A0ABV8Q6T1_9MICO